MGNVLTTICRRFVVIPTSLTELFGRIDTLSLQITRTFRTPKVAAVAIAIATVPGLLAVPANAANWTSVRRVTQVTGCAVSLLGDGLSTAAVLRAKGSETNPILGGGANNLAIIYGVKAAICGGTIVLSEYLHHRHKGYLDDRSAEIGGTAGGLIQTGVFTVLTIHNRRVLELIRDGK
jgi:hypothetical protein